MAKGTAAPATTSRRARGRELGTLGRLGLAALFVLALGAPEPDLSSAAAGADPLFVFTPTPPPVVAVPPPNGYLNGPCGLAVDGSGNFYVADHYHDVVDVYQGTADYTTPPVYGNQGYLGQLRAPDPLGGPCALAPGAGGALYVNSYHRSVRSYGPSPGFSPGPLFTGPGVDEAHPTGVAADPVSGRVYVDERTYVGVYEASGSPVEEAGEPLRIGVGNLADGYGAALSAFSGTAGYLYVADAASDTVKVYDPAADQTDPVATIAGPPGGFSSLRDASVAVDRVTGEVYVIDNLEPEQAETPRALVEVFDSSGAYQGHLEYAIVDGMPSGLAVDNSATSTQGRVYVTSGNTHPGAVYAYPQGAATTAAPLIGPAPPAPLGGTSLFPIIEIGGTAAHPGEEIECSGDACQVLPPQPRDPTLTTLVEGKGNPRVRYRRYARKRHQRRHHHRHRRGSRRRGQAASAALSAVAAPTAASGAGNAAQPTNRPPVPRATTLAPAPAGLAAKVFADGGAAAELAGSHPYSLELGLGLDQSGGEASLRRLRLEMPPGFFANPAASALCAAGSFATPRSSPFEASAAGESCPARSQLGTIDGEGPGGEVRRFGLFNLEPPDGVALRLGAAPFGSPLIFDLHFIEGEGGSIRLLLESSQVPQTLALHGLHLTIWGIPWDAGHNGERGDCLDEAEPSFPWSKCSAVGEPLSSPALAFLTLPTQCAEPLAFTAQAEAWSGPGLSAQAVNRDSQGDPVPVGGCGSLGFEPRIDGGLSTKHVSSPAGFALRLSQESPSFDGDPGFIDPRRRAEPRTRSALVRLPPGVTLNPSLGAGLEGCTPGQLAAATLDRAGCPNGSKIGALSMGFPFYKGSLKGSIYLAEPHANPYGSLLAVYLIARAGDRGILLKARGKLTPDPGDGTLTAQFDGLTQLPYSELTLEFRAGQRAPLVSPPSCAAAETSFELTSWASSTRSSRTDSPLEAGVEGAPCPAAVPLFSPAVVAGGVNANVGSYTPYFIHISRGDPEQEITSYSVVLPRGITGKLAGIPFCPEEAILAARGNDGFAESANPSCPASSRVGRTVSGYGVGPALAYSEGRVYLAGPYHGAPLSLVTINPATVGPFDLGTIVIRTAFELDPLTAQLRIDARASDRIPHIIDGVVLHLRDIRVYLDRDEFIRNPTSCEPSQLVSTLTGSGAGFGDSGDDSTATVSERFQLLNCRNLGFRPRLGLRLRGATRRGGYPALRATFASRGPRDSNLKRIEVDLPHQLFLAQSHIRTVCTRPEFAADHCPPGSLYGTATAQTPLLDHPLRGEVYLRSSAGRLPDLVATLRSGAIRIDLIGQIGPGAKGGIRTFFDELPDAPIERFTMALRGGRRGLFTNSVDVCAHPPIASIRALGQNNVGATFTTLLRGQCNQGAREHKHGHRADGGSR